MPSDWQHSVVGLSHQIAKHSLIFFSACLIVAVDFSLSYNVVRKSVRSIRHSTSSSSFAAFLLSPSQIEWFSNNGRIKYEQSLNQTWFKPRPEGQSLFEDCKEQQQQQRQQKSTMSNWWWLRPTAGENSKELLAVISLSRAHTLTLPFLPLDLNDGINGEIRWWVNAVLFTHTVGGIFVN